MVQYPGILRLLHFLTLVGILLDILSLLVYTATMYHCTCATPVVNYCHIHVCMQEHMSQLKGGKGTCNYIYT